MQPQTANSVESEPYSCHRAPLQASHATAHGMSEKVVPQIPTSWYANKRRARSFCCTFVPFRLLIALTTDLLSREMSMHQAFAYSWPYYISILDVE
ncbi:hypothetical protein D5086_021804 [Populus alba]|uniref:Uncharacterized protein n=1 Tax=Populus alba TaxID=43335 RepID=A0ACC4BDS3_POPAL